MFETPARPGRLDERAPAGEDGARRRPRLAARRLPLRRRAAVPRAVGRPADRPRDGLRGRSQRRAAGGGDRRRRARGVRGGAPVRGQRPVARAGGAGRLWSPARARPAHRGDHGGRDRDRRAHHRLQRRRRDAGRPPARRRDRRRGRPAGQPARVAAAARPRRRPPDRRHRRPDRRAAVRDRRRPARRRRRRPTTGSPGPRRSTTRSTTAGACSARRARAGA